MATPSKWLASGVLAAVLTLWNPSSHAGGDAIAVIVNRANPIKSIGVGELRPIFQTTKTSWGSSAGDVLPVNLPEDNQLRQQFDQAVLGLDPDRVARYWVDRKIRGGARAPLRVSTSGAMLKVVASKLGAVGYVPVSEVDATVKVVGRISDGKLGAP